MWCDGEGIGSRDKVGEAGLSPAGHYGCHGHSLCFPSTPLFPRLSRLTTWSLGLCSVIWGITEKQRNRKCDKNYPGATTTAIRVKILVFSTDTL